MKTTLKNTLVERLLRHLPRIIVPKRVSMTPEKPIQEPQNSWARSLHAAYARENAAKGHKTTTIPILTDAPKMASSAPSRAKPKLEPRVHPHLLTDAKAGYPNPLPAVPTQPGVATSISARFHYALAQGMAMSTNYVIEGWQDVKGILKRARNLGVPAYGLNAGVYWMPDKTFCVTLLITADARAYGDEKVARACMKALNAKGCRLLFTQGTGIVCCFYNVEPDPKWKKANNRVKHVITHEDVDASTERMNALDYQLEKGTVK